MDREVFHRLKTAADYQKKAIRALLPEKMEKHLDVIENEIKSMVLEAAAELVKGCGTKGGTAEPQSAQQASSEKTSARKVEIE